MQLAGFDGDRAAAQLELRAGVVRVGDRRVENEARVAEHVARLERGALHRDHQLPGDEVRLDGADPWGAVAADRPREHVAKALDELSAPLRQLGDFCLELAPVRHAAHNSAPSGVRRG
jgi:hypothetical protein